MAKRLPSLAALLGLVAIAGYQNRDKIGDFVKGLANNGGGLLPPPAEGDTKAADAAPPASIKGSLAELIDQFRHNGQEATARSWVDTGPNQPVSQPELERALGPELVDRLSKQTGLSRDELLQRLSKILPDAVDQMTPEGRIPS